MSDQWASAKNMVLAEGPGGTIIDIREGGQYERWHGFRGLSRDGLTCVDCTQPVNPRRLRANTASQRDILAHSPQNDGTDADRRCAEIRASGRGAGWKRVLVMKIGDYLERLGYRVELNPVLDGARADVAAYARQRRVLIRVVLDKLTEVDAKAEHLRLARDKADGYATEVLWVTFGCAWVDQLPAVGIRFDEEEAPESFDIGGVYAIVDSGLLRNGTKGLHQPAQSVGGLGAFLRLYMSRLIQYHPLDSSHNGWARASAWDSHIRSLLRRRTAANERITELEGQLRQMTTRLSDAESRARRAETSLNSTRAQLQNEQVGHIATTTALSDAQAWIDRIEEARQTRSIVRFALRNIPRHP